jgi:hypothetical protein
MNEMLIDVTEIVRASLTRACHTGVTTLISTSNSHSDQPGVGRVKKYPSGRPHRLPPSPASTKFKLKISMLIQEHLPLNNA